MSLSVELDCAVFSLNYRFPKLAQVNVLGRVPLRVKLVLETPRQARSTAGANARAIGGWMDRCVVDVHADGLMPLSRSCARWLRCRRAAQRLQCSASFTKGSIVHCIILLLQALVSCLRHEATCPRCATGRLPLPPTLVQAWS
jgi:hypothetical protein